MTNCLNFGNPYNPEVYWQFVHAIKGMGDACRKFDTPVTGGNVSFYNQSEEGPVYPTPTIGMVGVLDDYAHQMTLDFINPGNVILLIGESTDDINCSEYLKHIHGITKSPAPYFQLDAEFAVQGAVKELIKNKLLNSAHDISEGGLFISLLESAMVNGLGFEIETDHTKRADAFLFGEGQSRVVVSTSGEKVFVIENICKEYGVPVNVLGTVTSGKITVDGKDFGDVAGYKDIYDNAIGKYMEQEIAV